MRTRTIIAAGTIAVAIATPTAALAVNSSGGASDALDEIALERVLIDIQVPELCAAVHDGLAAGLDPEFLVEFGVDEYGDGWGDDFPPAAALYLAGILTGCTA